MPKCTLPHVNDFFCHAKIKSGKCPGFEERVCINTEALSALAVKRAVEQQKILADIHAKRREIDKDGYHFIDQNDSVVFSGKSVDETIRQVQRCMETVARHLDPNRFFSSLPRENL